MYIEGKMNQRVNKGKQKQLKNILASCHAYFPNIYKRVMRKKANIEVLSQVVPQLLVLSIFLVLKSSKSKKQVNLIMLQYFINIWHIFFSCGGVGDDTLLKKGEWWFTKGREK